MAEITKQDANPIIVAILNLLFGGVGFLIIGQKSKGILALIVTIILWVCCIFLAWVFFIPIICLLIWNVLMCIDGYKVAAKLAAGESVDECHCELAFLAKLPGFHQ